MFYFEIGNEDGYSPGPHMDTANRLVIGILIFANGIKWNVNVLVKIGFILCGFYAYLYRYHAMAWQ